MTPVLAATEFGSGPALTMLHGFTGNGQSWGPCVHLLAQAYGIRALDLPGHGGSGAIRATLSETAAFVAAQLEPSSVLLGYSLGGRVALHVSLETNADLRGLILIGATPGILDDQERADRRRADAALAARLRSENDLDSFLEEWLRGPLFADLPLEVQELAARRQNTCEGLAASLEDLGTGTQRTLWGDLEHLEVPTLLLVGELDTKFTALAEEMAAAMPNATVVVIPGAGHAVHLAKPTETAAAISQFVDGLPD